MSSHEIITLQIGNYANFVGGHWFNIQQDYLDPNSEFDPLTTWRQSLDTSGGIRSTIWSPRVLIFDLRQNWAGHLSTNAVSSSKNVREKLLLEAERSALWHGTVERIGELEGAVSEQISGKRRKENNIEIPAKEATAISTKLEKIEITQDDSKPHMKSWSDYVRWRLPSPEKTTFSLPNFSHNSSSGVLSNYGQGLDIYGQISDGVEDGIRLYAEDCDTVQGFQLLVDQNDGFSGIAKGVLQYISDEFDRKCCFAFGLSPANCEFYIDEQAGSFRKRLLNTALTWNCFNQHCSVFTSLGLCQDICTPSPIPLSMKWLNYQDTNPYESSAILAAAIDTFTTPYRLKTPSLGFSDLAGLLSGYGHKLTALGSAFPFSLLRQNIGGTGMTEQSLFQTLNENGLGQILQSLTPGVSLQSVLEPRKSFGNFFVARGISDNKVISESESKILQQQLRGGPSSTQIRTAQDCLEMYVQETYSRSLNVVRTSSTPFKLSYPFPTSLVDQTFLQTQPKYRYQTQDFWRLPAMASAHNTMEAGVLLEKLLEEVSIAKLRRSNFNFEESSIEADDFSECLNDLRILRDSYDNN